MLSITDIESLIKSGEGYNTEFKKKIPSKVREITEEVCAFANAVGGTVLLGVDDDNNIVGISFDNKNVRRFKIQSVKFPRRFIVIFTRWKWMANK